MENGEFKKAKKLTIIKSEKFIKEKERRGFVSK